MSILASIDYTDHAPPALRLARRLAEALRTEMRILHCRPGPTHTWRHGGTAFEDEGGSDEHELEAFVSSAIGDPTPDRPITLHLAPPPLPEAVERIAGHDDIHLCVTGSTHRGTITQFLSESTSETLVRRCSVPIAVVPPDRPAPPLSAPILAPVDPTLDTRESFGLALQLARRTDTRLVVVHAKTGGPFYRFDPVDTTADAASLSSTSVGRQLSEFLRQFDLRQVAFDVVVRPGSPAVAIRETAEAEQCGLVVMGRHDRLRLREFFLGSTTHRVLRDLPCPVIIVPDTDERAGVGLPELVAGR